MSSTTKNIQIGQTFKETKKRRQTQMPLVFECKVKKHMLNAQQLETLKMMFIEAKWIYNYILNLSNDHQLDIFNFKMKDLKEVWHFNKDHEYVNETLKYIGSSMKDSLLDTMIGSIKALAKLKENGHKVGALDFISEYKSITLKQYNITHKVISSNKIKVQGIKKALPVTGLKQLEKLGLSFEYANAQLIQKNGDYYIHLTVMVNRQDYKELKSQKNNYINYQLGIDFGCSTTFTLSTGEKINVSVEETDRLKRLQRKLQRQKKGSNGRYKTKLLIRKEYEKITRQKNEKANQLVARLLRENQEIIIQDEQLNAWKPKHGKKIQHSILGRVKSLLINAKKLYPDRIFVLNRFVPTTKLCSDCGHIHSDIQLWDREFICPECGCVYDRDIHAAQNMIWIHNNIIGVDGPEFKREDFEEQLAAFQRKDTEK